MLLAGGCEAPAGGGGGGGGAAGRAARAIDAYAATPWQFGDAAGTRIDTPHYEVYSTVADVDYNQRLAATMEAALPQYRALTGLPLAPDADGGRMRCYVFATRVQFEAFTRTNLPESADEYLSFNRGGYTVGDVFASHYAGDGTLATAAHEGFHQYLHRALRDSMPPFLEEGLASTFESLSFGGIDRRGRPTFDLRRNTPLANALHVAVTHDVLIPLRELATLHAGDVVGGDEGEAAARYPRELFYAQSWAFARFLLEAEGGRYRPALRQLFADAAAGRLYGPPTSPPRPPGTYRPSEVVAALERALGAPLDSVDPAYRAFVRQIARPPATYE